MFVQNDCYPDLVCVRAVKPLDGLLVHVFSNGSEGDNVTVIGGFVYESQFV